MKTYLNVLSATFMLSISLALPAQVSAQNAGNAPYLKETHGDWEIRCILPQGARERCQIYQKLSEATGNEVGEINIFVIEPGEGAVAGAVIITPLGTLLTSQLALKIGDLDRKRYPFAWCTQVGCVARIGLTVTELAAFKQSSQAAITIVSVSTPDTPVVLAISLKGFAAAFAAMQAANQPG